MGHQTTNSLAERSSDRQNRRVGQSASRALIDRTYALEDQLPPAQGDWKPSAEIIAFATERARASTRFTASLYLTAWQKSARLRLPPWLEREGE